MDRYFSEKYELHPHSKSFISLLLKIDPVVQLVRMPPCHGGGRGFESRPDRRESSNCRRLFLFISFYIFRLIHEEFLYNFLKIIPNIYTE